MKQIKAKKLEWYAVIPEVFESWSINANIAVLTLNGRPAYYQVSKVSNCIGCQLWVGNQGITIKDWLFSNTEGKRLCQQHYNSLVRENAEYVRP